MAKSGEFGLISKAASCEATAGRMIMETQVLIQDRVTQLYFRRLGSWTQHETEAFCFSSATQALLFCFRHELRTSQIVVKFGGQKEEIRFKLNEEGIWDRQPWDTQTPFFLLN